MNEEFEHIGYWWLPESPDKKVPGKLKFTLSGGALLDLQGSLKGKTDLQSIFQTSAYFNPPLVLGISNSGKAITLFQCHERGNQYNVSGGITSELRAKWVFIDAHFDSPDEVKFKSLSIHYAHLDSWVNKSGFTIDHSNYSQNKVIVHYERPSPFQMKLGDFELVIETSGPSISYDHIRQVKIEQQSWVKLKSSTEKPIEDFIEIMRHIQNFLTLAMACPTYPLIVRSTAEVKKESPNEPSTPDLPIDVFYQLPWQPIKVENHHSFEMLFTLPAVSEHLETYITNWIEATELLKPVYDLYFSILYNSHMYLESKFINLSQAIETYHRRRFGGKYQSDEEYREGLYQKLLAAIPPDLDKNWKQSLKSGRLLYANEYSLRKRLQDLLGKISKNIPLSFINDNFVDKVCDTRNYLTHYDPLLKLKSAEGVELHSLIETLQVILEICFLKELGFGYEAIRKMISENKGHRHVLSSS